MGSGSSQLATRTTESLQPAYYVNPRKAHSSYIREPWKGLEVFSLRRFPLLQLLLGFEPKFRDSKSRVITTTLQEPGSCTGNRTPTSALKGPHPYRQTMQECTVWGSNPRVSQHQVLSLAPQTTRTTVLLNSLEIYSDLLTTTNVVHIQLYTNNIQIYKYTIYKQLCRVGFEPTYYPA